MALSPLFALGLACLAFALPPERKADGGAAGSWSGSSLNKSKFCSVDYLDASDTAEVHTVSVELPAVSGAVVRTSHAEVVLNSDAAVSVGCLAVQTTLVKTEAMHFGSFATPPDARPLSPIVAADARPAPLRNVTSGVVVTLPLVSPVDFRSRDVVPVCRWRASHGDAWVVDSSCEVTAYTAARVSCRCSRLGQYSVSAGRRASGVAAQDADLAARQLQSRSLATDSDLSSSALATVGMRLVTVVAVPVTSLLAIAVFAGCVLCRGRRVHEMAHDATSTPTSPLSPSDHNHPVPLAAGDEAQPSPTASSDSSVDGQLVRKPDAPLAEQRRAAIVIQRAWRGYRAHKRWPFARPALGLLRSVRRRNQLAPLQGVSSVVKSTQSLQENLDLLRDQILANNNIVASAPSTTQPFVLRGVLRKPQTPPVELDDLFTSASLIKLRPLSHGGSSRVHFAEMATVLEITPRPDKPPEDDDEGLQYGAEDEYDDEEVEYYDDDDDLANSEGELSPSESNGSDTRAPVF